ncbi:MAG: hypothetical protein AAF184_15705 [Pseudomonadota bacterium]
MSVHVAYAHGVLRLIDDSLGAHLVRERLQVLRSLDKLVDE